MVGRKFNDGMEYAGTHGAQWIVPIGSDSWIDPAYFLDLESHALHPHLHGVLHRHRRLTGRAAGRKRRLSAGPFVFHRAC